MKYRDGSAQIEAHFVFRLLSTALIIIFPVNQILQYRSFYFLKSVCSIYEQDFQIYITATVK